MNPSKIQTLLAGAFTTCCVLGLGAQDAPPPPPRIGVVVEAEDFKPQGDGWKVIQSGQGNYMVDNIGFNHISGERVLSAPAKVKDAKAVATVQIPKAGEYRVWSRYETPTGTEERFKVEIRQGGKRVAEAVMGEKQGPKFWFGSKTSIGQYDASWGSEGLAEQSFDVKGLQAGPAEITLIALDQPEPAADRNVDFLFLTTDLKDSWREQPGYNPLYPIMDAALECIPPRYYARFTSPEAVGLTLSHTWNRANWSGAEPGGVTLEAVKPSAWIPLTRQDVAHVTTLCVTGDKPGLDLRVEFAGSANGTPVFRTIDWKDPASNQLLIGLPAYPGRYKDERIMTVEEQYQEITAHLKGGGAKVGKDPKVALAWGGSMPIWSKGRVADAAADLYHEMGMRVFGGYMQPPTLPAADLDVARERFKKWGLTPGRTIALGQYRFMPTAENIAMAKKAAEDAKVMSLIHRFDYGDEIGFGEWLSLLKAEEINARFAEWQVKKHGKAAFTTPMSDAKTAETNAVLFVDSMEFYEDVSIAKVAELAKEIPKALGPDVTYGANVACHPFYYPEIPKYIKWFRGGAATFGRHSEYFWQIGQPGPLINGYIADHFRSGMRDLPKSEFLQYTMPHSPGNSDQSFRRSAFTHLAHGARNLDYFGIGVNNSFTENYIDFRDKARFAALRDVNRSMALIEDILPESRVVPSQVAMILSDSTERWDFSGIAGDKAALDVFGANYRKARLSYHLDRLGIYYALVHGSRSPDMLIEEDVVKGLLKDFKVAYWVGDCADPKVVPALEAWVKAGGHLVTTAGSLRFNAYRQPMAGGLALLGLKSAKLDEKQTFFRPQIEMPRLTPLDSIGNMPVFGVVDRVEAASDAKVAASFKSGSAAVVERTLGKGRITFIAALPGVTYLWSAHQPPQVPPRGVWSHAPLVNFNAEAAQLILIPAKAAAAQVEAEGGLIDARLLKSPKGYAVPLANYSGDVQKPVTITIRGVKGIKKIISASQGDLKMEKVGDDGVKVTYPTGYGDILRIEAGS